MKRLLIGIAVFVLTASASFSQIGGPGNPVLPGGGPVAFATALAANGANCSAGSFPLGVDASGAAESCTAAVLGSTGATDNAILAADGTGGATLQTRAITISDVSGFIVTLASTPGNALSLVATAPAATTGASQAGKAASLTASDAVASTDTAGAAAGGSVTITAGAAARNTSGNANGGDINLVTGAGTGTGTAGQVVVPAGVIGAPGLAFTGDSDTGIYNSAANFFRIAAGGSSIASFSLSGVGGSGTSSLFGFRAIVSPVTTGSGAPTAVATSTSQTIYTNEGATAQVYFTLQTLASTATTGICVEFAVQDADGIRITAGASDTIRIGANVSAAAGYIQNSTIGSVIRLCSINLVEWFSMGTPSGTWTIDS